MRVLNPCSVHNRMVEELGPLRIKELESIERQLDMSLKQIRSIRLAQADGRLPQFTPTDELPCYLSSLLQTNCPAAAEALVVAAAEAMVAAAA
ncbi:hypothetical protein SOVF_176370 [Spinacia oleracea]|nr:hypothetical protein SOVF_176370 [Spinacia oleracea]